MSEPGDAIFFQIGGLLHEARMIECYGKMETASRRKWPATFKDFRRQRMDGQPWIDAAIAQVRALVKAGVIQSASELEAPHNSSERLPTSNAAESEADTI